MVKKLPVSLSIYPFSANYNKTIPAGEGEKCRLCESYPVYVLENLETIRNTIFYFKCIYMYFLCFVFVNVTVFSLLSNI